MRVLAATIAAAGLGAIAFITLTGGSDSQAFQRLYDAAQPGATVTVPCGTYEPQTIIRNGKPQTAPVTLKAETPLCAKTGTITLGADTGTESGNAPSMILDGLETDGSVTCYWHAGAALTGIGLRNGVMYDTSSAGDGFSCGNSDGTFVRDYKFRARCCRGNPIAMGLTNVGTPPNTNHSYERIEISDIRDSCRFVVGSCTGTGYGDGVDTRHIDGMQFIDCHRCSFRQIRMERVGGASGQGIFLAVNNGGSFSDLTFEDITIGDTPQTEFSVSGPGVGILTGFLRLTRMQVAGDVLLYDRVAKPGTEITVDGVNATGKLGGYSGGSSVSCTLVASDGSTLSPSWLGNTGDPNCDGPPPPAPTLAKGACGFKVSWPTVSGATGYRVTVAGTSVTYAATTRSTVRYPAASTARAYTVAAITTTGAVELGTVTETCP